MAKPLINFVATIGTVVDVAIDVINRPTLVSRVPHLTDLAMLVDDQGAILVEGGNPIRAEVGVLLGVLAQVEGERQAGGNPDRAERWSMIAGALLPMVRANLADALAHRARAATTDHDFTRSRE